MKFAISPEDKIAVVIAILPHAGRSPEQMDARLTAWDDLGVRKFARALARTGTATGRLAGAGGVTDADITDAFGRDLVSKQLVDLQPETVRWLIAELGYDIPGTMSDQLSELRAELKELQEKRYQLPQELRAAVASAP